MQTMATFADAKRTWCNCPPNQLEAIIESSSAAAKAADYTSAKSTQVNLLVKAVESAIDKRRNPENGGRTLQDAVDLVNGESNMTQFGDVSACVFQKPVLLSADDDGNVDGNRLVSSQLNQQSCQAAEKMQRYIEIRNKLTKDRIQLRSMKRSVEYHQTTMKELQSQRATVLQSNNVCVGRMDQLDEIKENEQNCIRVLAQLQRQLTGFEQSYASDVNELCQAKREVDLSFNQMQHTRATFRNPSGIEHNNLPNRLVLDVVKRQSGLDRFRDMPRIRKEVPVTLSRKALLFSRLSHAATINTHLAYPVYCLRFDRTGRYFISGADDYLVRVFCVGSNIKVDRSAGFGSTIRGAVLVCTLRGHAGVINNIDVSPDNIFLATAAEDGDCRVWGLKDGSPIAILRGHKGGANTVVWSATTPYRLVTAGGDGLARSWDIREACLRRYGKVIGSRPEYCLPLSESEKSEAKELTGGSLDIQSVGSATMLPPPDPVRQEDSEERHQILPALGIIPFPAVLHAAIDAAPHNANQDGNHEGEQVEGSVGRFVANDNMDEGVRLVNQYQHGSTNEEQANGSGTRSRRSAVKVLCVARCPFGGHFATGSDDGVCRIWRDSDDLLVEQVDSKFSDWSKLLTQGSFAEQTRNGKFPAE